jgi:predicted alpha/beta superfamily hydrolase
MSMTVTMTGLLDAEYFDVQSKCVGDTFRIFVARPPFVPPRKYPAIYVADGNGSFLLATAIQRMLSLGAECPPAYVIGIGYPTESGFVAAMAKRNRDYVPTDGGDYARAVLNSTVAPGGEAFQRFIREELKPSLEARYDIDPGDATFFGSSLGGLIGAWILLTAPDTFQRYILASPTISWNQEEVWQWEQAYASAHQDLKATVLVSAGSLEAPEVVRANAVHIAKNSPMVRAQVESIIAWCDREGWPRTTDLPHEFAARLRSRNYPGLKIHSHTMPDETHMSVSPVILSRGLRYVFGHWQPFDHRHN